MNYSDFFQAVYDEYGIRQGSEEARRIMEKIAANKGSYKDIYEYALNRGEDLAAILRQTIVNHDYNMHREEAVEEARQFAEILLSYQEDVNTAAAKLQEKINEDLGIHIRPQVSDPARDRAEGLAGKIFTEDEIKISNAENEISNFGMAAVDETIRRNADFQAKSGFETVIVREYDGIGLRRGTKYQEDCDWCRERAGVYNYRDVAKRGSEVWRRHVGCGCTIDFVRNGKTQRVSNYVIEKGQQKAGTARNLNRIEKKTIKNKKLTQDVTQKYLSEATPGKGKLISYNGADTADIETAKWIIKNIGGTVELLEVQKINGMNVQTPDSIKDGIYCEFKKCSSFTTADSRLKRAAHQLLSNAERKGIQNERCIILIDISNCNEKADKMIYYIEQRIPLRCKLKTDVIIRDGDMLKKVIRFDKK